MSESGLIWAPPELQPIETQIFEAEGLWVKQVVVPKAHTYLPQHAHVLSHLTLLAVGAVNVWMDGQFDARHDAPSAIHIKAGVKHMFETLVDGTVLYCVHALTTPEALKILAEHDILG